MRHYDNTAQFYRGDDWANCKAQVTAERIKADGCLYCELCGKPIVKNFNPSANNNAGAVVYHHKVYLNNYNVNDAAISINPANIMVLHWQCHNIIHGRFNGSGQQERKVYIITGASCSGKTSFVKERLQEGDLVLDIDDLWQLVSGQPRYVKPNSLKPIVFNLRQEIKDNIARGVGTWRNAYIIESLPYATDRKREAERYKAHNVELITMDATREQCLERLHTNPNGRDIKQYEQYINDYYDNYI